MNEMLFHGNFVDDIVFVNYQHLKRHFLNKIYLYYDIFQLFESQVEVLNRSLQYSIANVILNRYGMFEIVHIQLILVIRYGQILKIFRPFHAGNGARMIKTLDNLIGFG